MTTDSGIYQRIKQLVDEEHELGKEDAAERAHRRQAIEAELDQCWDLLRQRQARREFGESPEGAKARPVEEVEGYLQ